MATKATDARFPSVDKADALSISEAMYEIRKLNFRTPRPDETPIQQAALSPDAILISLAKCSQKLPLTSVRFSVIKYADE